MPARGRALRTPPSGRERVVLLFLLVVSAAAHLSYVSASPISNDEVITLLETSGHGLPWWPTKPVTSEAAREVFRGSAGPGQIIAELLDTDIHPPLYFWILTLWRRAFGFSIETARYFSVACSLVALVFFYRLLRTQSAELACVGTAVGALAPGLLFTGTDARPYTLALLLLSAAAFLAYCGAREASRGSRAGAGHSAGMAVCCGLAFDTNYLTLFSIAAILAWYFLTLWRRRRAHAILFPLLALAVALIALPFLLRQVGARPDQESGYPGLATGAKTVAKMALMMTSLPDYSRDAASYATALAVAALLGLAVYRLWRKRRDIDRGFWLLLLGLAATPAVGILVLNPIFDKYLRAPRYLAFAGPAAAALVSYPIAAAVSRGRLTAAILLAALLLFRTARATVNIVEAPNMRQVARAIEASGKGSRVVILDQGSGR